MSAFSDVKKALKRTSRLDDDLKRAFRDIRKHTEVIDEIQNARRWAGGRINEIDDTLEKLPTRIEDDVEEAITDKVPELVTDVLPKAVKGMVEKLASEAVKPGLRGAADAARSMHGRMVRIEKNHPDLIDAINEWSRSIDLQAVACIGLDYANFYARALAVASILDRYASEGIAIRRRDIKAFLTATSADTIRYGAGGELSLGLQLGASYTESMPSALFIVLADEILKDLGVPE